MPLPPKKPMPFKPGQKGPMPGRKDRMPVKGKMPMKSGKDC